MIVIPPGKFLVPLIGFFLCPRWEHRRSSWQHKHARAVGLLFDFVKAHELAGSLPTDLLGRTDFLKAFARRLCDGSDIDDGLGLDWPAFSWKSVKEVLACINTFSDFCVDEYGSLPLNPMVPATFGERVANYRKLQKVAQSSPLRHIADVRKHHEKAALARRVNTPRPPKVRASNPPAFPPERFGELLNVGFRRSDTGPVWQQYRIREMMLSVLQRHGGVRESEGFHLFPGDVREVNGTAEVRLYHPRDGRVGYYDRDLQKQVYTTRADYLHRVAHRVGRFDLPSGSGAAAGWKDLLLDVGAPHYYAIVRWFPSVWGQVFLELYKTYVRHLLPKALGHPYLFVNLKPGEDFGEPYRIESYNEALQRALRRIGLESRKELGTTSHGFRHRYGRDLEDADVPEKIIQLCMHHKSVESQRIYTLPTSGAVNEELKRAHAHLASRAELKTTERTLEMANRDLQRDPVRLLQLQPPPLFPGFSE